VYKKTDSGWSQYKDGGWNSVDAPDRVEPRSGSGQVADYSKDLESARAQQRSGSTQRQYGGAGSYNRDTSRLNRDYSARQRGSYSYQQRRGGFSRAGGGFSRGGGGRRR
jgi:hypothetical protein